MSDDVSVARIEWTRLDGSDVEAVVAMFVNREHPNSVRITPSRGDGGVDILDRGAGPNGTDVIYQVKRYTEPLEAREKAAVEGSLMRLKEDARWARLNVLEWHLVTPWDPTPEAENWLHDFGSEHDLRAVWNGLTHVEQLASKYMDVVDYYLHGGSTKIQDAYNAVAALFGAERVDEGLRIPEVTRKLRLALPTLDQDPHYRYELRFGEGQLPKPSRPGLVLSWLTGEGDGGPWTMVDVIARCAASVYERPITIKGNIRVDRGSDLERSLQDFLSYGGSFSAEGAFHGEVDAPGGLGGPLEGATLTAMPVADNQGDNPERLLEILNPEGTVLAAVNAKLIDVTQGKDGIRVLHQEQYGLFTLEDRHNVVEKTMTRIMTLGDITGVPVIPVERALNLVVHSHAPNALRVCARHMPPEHGVIDHAIDFPWTAEMRYSLSEIVKIVNVLSLFQRHTSTVIKIPAPGAVSPQQQEQWLFAQELLRDGESTVTYPEGRCLVVDLEAEAPTPAGTFGVIVPLTVQVGDQSVDLGVCEAWLDTPNLIQRSERNGRSYHALTTPDRRVVFRRGAQQANPSK
ncbi:restriction endonuclease [Flindersiella endophytica]